MNPEEKPMKKTLLALGIILVLLALTGLALADGATVSFPKSGGSVNGGFSYSITMKVKKAAETDLEIPLTCRETGESLTVRIPAGSLEGSTEYATEPVEKTVSRTFVPEAGEGYTVKDKSFTLKILPLPVSKFYASVSFGYVGRTTTVNITFRNPSHFVKGTTLQLRDQDGNVLDEKTWNSGEGLHAFKVPVTKEITGKRLLSVWMGDYKISEQNGYGAFTDLGNKAIRRVETDQPLVALTLDCGWYGRQMPLILPILEKYGVHCTFFMTGFFIRTYTQEARDAVAGGHEIANHTNLHPKMAKDKNKTNRLAQLAVPNKNAMELLGVRPRLFRPPYGDYDKEVMALCRAEGMEIIIWTVDSHDWDVRGGYTKYPEGFEKMWKRVTKKIEPGYIILFHLDGKQTPAILDKLIPYIQDELGYRCVTVSELLASGGYELPPVVEEGTEDFYEEDPHQDDAIPADATEG